VFVTVNSTASGNSQLVVVENDVPFASISAEL